MAKKKPAEAVDVADVRTVADFLDSNLEECNEDDVADVSESLHNLTLAALAARQECDEESPQHADAPTFASYSTPRDAAADCERLADKLGELNRQRSKARSTKAKAALKLDPAFIWGALRPVISSAMQQLLAWLDSRYQAPGSPPAQAKR